MLGGEGVIAQIAGGHGRAQAFGQLLGFFYRIAHHHAATGQDHGELGGLQQFDGLVQRLFAAMATVHAHGLGDLAFDLAVEVVARDIELRGAHLRHGAVEAAAGEFGHALGVDHVALVLGELLEHRQLVGFLEAAQAHAHGAGFGRDDDLRAVRPEGGGDAGHAVGNARAVLADDQAVAAGNARIAVGHVRGALFVDHRNQADACGREDVHRIHEGRTHDAEHLGHAIGHAGFDERLGRRHLVHAFDDLAIVCGGFSHLCLLKGGL
ncbi:hypothetical protein SDC9_105175 [bioreactor metagenome]|uniref:NAD-specific glutamate dehydrogenase n=1 Tax=bioreactor metagenome TaxID=1076179 RepID=A0A645B9J3_9ZZZZ